MNPYKEEWMMKSSFIQTAQISSPDRDPQDNHMSADDAGDLGVAVAKTNRAIILGAAISAMDGPLPVMDVVGFSIAAVTAGLAWYDYFS
jgi:hypothetical protein